MRSCKSSTNSGDPRIGIVLLGSSLMRARPEIGQVTRWLHFWARPVVLALISASPVAVLRSTAALRQGWLASDIGTQELVLDLRVSIFYQEHRRQVLRFEQARLPRHWPWLDSWGPYSMKCRLTILSATSPLPLHWAPLDSWPATFQRCARREWIRWLCCDTNEYEPKRSE